jgi:cell division protein FtsB
MARRTRESRHPDFPEAPPERGFFGKPTLFVFWVFVVAACLAAAIPAIPQYRILQSMENELADVLEEEKRLEAKKAQLEAEVQALKTNKAYLEARSRDSLRRYKPGENVVEFKN